MRTSRRAALRALVATVAAAAARPALATVGAAEWQVETPGGSRIVHLDPYKERHGTCLLGPGGDDEVYVSNIRWWQYYATYVLGEAESGFFLFDEVSRRVDWYDNVHAARTRATQRSGSRETSAVLRGPPAAGSSVAR
jgi:hypothetical protein